MSDIENLERYHTRRSVRDTDGKDAATAPDEKGTVFHNPRMRPVHAVRFYSSPTVSRVVPTHAIQCIAANLSIPTEHRIGLVCNAGAVHITGSGLEALARDLHLMIVSEVKAGQLESGGMIDRVQLD